MTHTWERWLFWTPRLLSILFAAFLGVFAADAFSESRGPWSTAAGLILHLVPSAAILLMLVIAWRREWLGGLLYLAFGLVFLVASWGSADWIGLGAMSVLPLVIALGFLAHWWLWRGSPLKQGPSS